MRISDWSSDVCSSDLWTVSEDKLTYTFTLRDGLTFHDGEPVTAADAVASLKRWGGRDSGGQLIFDVTESLEATDDRTITWTLSEPFPPFLETIAKQSAVPPFIMPERVASTPPRSEERRVGKEGVSTGRSR